MMHREEARVMPIAVVLTALNGGRVRKRKVVMPGDDRRKLKEKKVAFQRLSL